MLIPMLERAHAVVRRAEWEAFKKGEVSVWQVSVCTPAGLGVIWQSSTPSGTERNRRRREALFLRVSPRRPGLRSCDVLRLSGLWVSLGDSSPSAKWL